MAKPPPQVTRRPIHSSHVMIRSQRTFASTLAALRAAIPPIQDCTDFMAEFGSGDPARRLAALQGLLPSLVMFAPQPRDFGPLLLQPPGRQRRALQFEIGNPWTAARLMQKAGGGAKGVGLAVPIRVLLREDGEGPEREVGLEYEAPLEKLVALGGEEVRGVAAELDAALLRVLGTVAGGDHFVEPVEVKLKGKL